MIIFTTHALLKLQHRRITKSQAIETIIHPDEVVSGRDGRLMAVKRIGKKHLKVIFVRKGKHTLVITQYFID